MNDVLAFPSEFSADPDVDYFAMDCCGPTIGQRINSFSIKGVRERLCSGPERGPILRMYIDNHIGNHRKSNRE